MTYCTGLIAEPEKFTPGSYLTSGIFQPNKQALHACRLKAARYNRVDRTRLANKMHPACFIAQGYRAYVNCSHNVIVDHSICGALIDNVAVRWKLK